MIPEYTFTGDKNAPAIINLGKYSTPVWIQQNWTQGEYAQFVRKNGCGHCCTAMALNLNGVKINPHEEFTLCRKMWGEPRMYEPVNEDNFLSVSGIEKVLVSFGVNAKCYGVPKGETLKCAKHIEDSLKDGKLVILVSEPSDRLPDNPFSTGLHYVLAVSADDDGKILVANSSMRSAAINGIQYTDYKTIAKVLWDGAQPGDYTWGRYDFPHTCGYVVVG
ncbi:MAG: hypothetical protein IKJ68_12350 [Clostridia bacterium]|nr:hypothetical protein [Clostridia bacterium]